MIKLICFWTIIVAITFNSEKLLSEDVWSVYTKANEIALYDIKSMSFGNADEIYFSASQRLFKLSNDKIEDITNYNYDTDYYNIRKLYFHDVLWGASENGFMNYFPANDSLVFFDRKHILGDWNYEYILNLEVDDKGRTWFATRTPYISVFDGNNFIDLDVGLNNKIIELPFLHVPMLIGDENSLWIGGNDGIVNISTNSTPENIIYQKYSLQELGFSKIVIKIMKDDFGNIWTSSRNGEVSLFKDNVWKSIPIPDSLKSNIMLEDQNNYIATIGKDNYYNIILFWASENYFLKIDTNMKYSKIMFPNDIVPSTVFVKSFLCDIDNNYYMGTLQNGLIKYSPSVTSVENNTNDRQNYINIHPNPATEYITIQTSEVSDVRIFNTLGECVLTTPSAGADTPPKDGNLRIDVSHLPAGIYFIKIGDNIEKFVKW